MEEYPSLESEYRGNGCGLDPEFEVTLLEPRPFRPFKSSEEYLYAMKEDLAEWLNGLYEGLRLNAENFLEQMETGVVLCRHANNVVRKAREYYRSTGGTVEVPIPDRDVVYRSDVLPETFHARDNVSNFISWCRALHIKECLLFETDDLVLRKNERSFILCLLEVARRGAKFGMPAPLLVQLEQEIDAELANDDGYQTSFRVPQVVTNDLRSLHERVVELLSRCTCPSQFPMIRVADGKYRIGDTKVLIFVRILRSHVMVRVGGGWDTLEHYLDKHDPCRCRSGHRLSTSAKLTMHQGKSSIPSMHVTYNRPPQAPSSTPSSPQGPRRSMPCTTTQHSQADRTDSPPRYPPQLGGSDDSSASNDGRRPPAPHKKKKKKGPTPVPQSGGSSSVEELSEEEDDNSLRTWAVRSPQIAKRNAKREFLKDTVPSSWQYSPANDQSPPSTLVHQRKGSGGPPTKMGPTTRLPSLTSRNKGLQPPQVVKVSPRLLSQTKWPDQRSQSTEDLYLNANSGPAHKNLVFHSRGTSPVNLKGRHSASSAVSFGTPKDFPASLKNKENVSVDSFRRNDPVRHSSYHSPTYYPKRSPPRPPPKQLPSQETRQVRKTSPIGYNRRGFVSPERCQYSRKHSDKGTSPVLEKLLHSDLCSDESFVRKIEMLIAEYQVKPKKRDSLDDGFDKDSPRSLPLDLQDKLDSVSHQRRSSKDTDRRSPSKIPLPTWH